MEAHAELEIGDFKAFLGKVDESLSALDKSIKHFSRDTPFFPRTLVSQNGVGAAATYIIDLGAPSQGKLWCITALAIFRQASPANPPGQLTSCTVYLGNAEDNLTDAEVLVPSLGTNAAPGFQTFGDETIYQFPSENLFFVVTVGGAGQGVAMAKVKEYAIDDVMPRVI